MNLQQVFESADYKISGGGEFLWDCFGGNAHCIDFASDEVDGKFNEVCMRFDTQTRVVYSIEVYVAIHDLGNDVAFVWYNPAYKQEYFNEAIRRNVDPAVAYDDTSFIVKDNETEILEIISAVINNEDVSLYVSTCLVELKFPKEDLFDLLMAAHKRDITFNEFLQEILADAVKVAEDVIRDSEEKESLAQALDDAEPDDFNETWVTQANYVANGRIYSHQYCVENDFTRLIDDRGRVEFTIDSTNNLFARDDGGVFHVTPNGELTNPRGNFFTTGATDRWALTVYPFGKNAVGKNYYSTHTDLMKAEPELLWQFLNDR
jgi:hypothetical protein